MKISNTEFDFWLRYCKELAQQYKVVSMAVKAAKVDRLKARKNALDAMGVNPDKGTEIGQVPIVTCAAGGTEFLVVWPEGWLDVINNALELITDTFSADVADALRGVYFDGQTRLTACAEHNVNYQVFSAVYDKQFQLFMVALAAYANLLPSEPKK